MLGRSPSLLPVARVARGPVRVVGQKAVGAEGEETAAQHFTYAELEENDVDLKKLQVWFEKIKKLDFYNAELAAEAAERLKGCERLLDAYAQRVFEAHDENR